MREGSIYRRCTECGERVDGRTCEGCGSHRFSWTGVVDVAPPGAPRQQRRRTAPTKAALLEELADLQQDHADGTYVEPSRRTLGSYLATWVEAHRPPVCSPSTHAWRKLAVRRYLAPLADVPLRALDRQTIKKLYRDLADHGRVRGDGGLAITSVHRVHATLHAALEEAVRDRLIATNPADGAHRLPDRARPEIKAWDADELARLLETCRADELYPLWRTAAWTGCRRGELVALRWRDVGLEAGVLVIRRNAVKGVDGSIQEVPPKSARGRRSLDLDDTTLEVLMRHRAETDGDGYVFAHPRTGERLHPDAVSTRFLRLVRESGVRRLTFHSLRHTHATLLLAEGVALHVVSRRLGHASEAFTARRYAHVLPQQQRDAVNRVARSFDEGS